jgi:hypothetical protein
MNYETKYLILNCTGDFLLWSFDGGKVTLEILSVDLNVLMSLCSLNIFYTFFLRTAFCIL